MAKADGRIEQGQSIKSAFSAAKWNDLCDAADVVLGRNGGTSGGGAVARDRAVISAKASTAIRAGYWVFLSHTAGEINVRDAADTAGRATMFRNPVANTAYLQPSGATNTFVGMAIESARAGSYFRVQVSGAVFTFLAMRHRYHGFASFADPYSANGDEHKVFPLGTGGSQLTYIPTSAISGQMRIVWFDDTEYVTPKTTSSTAAICPAIVVL